MDNTEAPAGPTVWRLRGSSATDSRDCLATDWWGLLLAHNVAGNLEKAITAAVAAGRQLGDVLEAHPEVVVDPVVEDLRHEPASPLAARIDGMARRSVLALDPFSTGFWQVETVSGSRHILDLTGGGYRRISDVPFGEMDDDWYGIESLHEWPAVNATFTVQLFPRELPEEGEEIDEATLKEMFDAAPFLASAFVTRIVKIAAVEADTGGIDLPPVGDIEVLSATPPRNAWLLMANDDSSIDLAEVNRYGALWTSPKHVERGDLAFIYYISPHKAVLYAARVQSPPTYADPDVDEDALAKWPKQWWSWVGAFVELDPVPYSELKRYFGGQLVMKGKGGRYVPPWVVTQLLLDQPAEPTKDLVLQVPSANPELPDAADSLTLDEWKGLASGAFRFEVDVEHYIVEPLLSWLVEGKAQRRWRSKAQLGPLVPDYSLFAGDSLTAVVEVKLGTRGVREGNNWGGPDLDQVRNYCTVGGVPGLLVDSNRILLFDAGDPVPVAVYERARLSHAQLAMIRRHVFPQDAAD